MARRLWCIGVVLGGLLAGSGPAWAGEGPSSMGPLQPALQIGADGAWEGLAEGGTYVLQNDAAADAIRYFYVTSVPGEEGRRRVSLRVDAGAAGESAIAGLLYGLSEDRGSYYLFGVAGDGTARIYHRLPNEPIQSVATVEGDFVKSQGFNELVLVELQTAVDAYVNGERVMTLGEPGIGKGAVGIIAWGRGRFLFRDFAIEQVSDAAVARVGSEAAAPGPEGGEPAAQGNPVLAQADQPPVTVPPQGQAQGQMPGQVPGQMPYPQGYPQMPGQFPAQVPGYPPGQFPYVEQQPWPGMQPMPGQFPGQVPGYPPQGQVPGYPQQPFPGQMPGQPPVMGQQPMGQPPIMGQQPTVPIMPGQLPQAQPVAPLPGQPVTAADTTGDSGVQQIIDYARRVTTLPMGVNTQTSTPPGWESYVDPGTGMVTASYPRGWTIAPVARGIPGMAVEFAQVQISSPDGFHYIEGVTRQQGGGLDLQGYVQDMIGQYAARFGLKREMAVDNWVVRKGMQVSQFAVRAVEAGDYVIVVLASGSTVGVAGMSMTFMGHRIVIGPTGQFSGMAQSTYIPILASMIGW